MAALRNIFRTAKAVQNITKVFNNVLLPSNHNPVTTAFNISKRFASNDPAAKVPAIQESKPVENKQEKIENPPGLMEFFDVEKNWGQDHVRVGRSWNKDELRLKSNEDLHKLWYILLKERNMLLTMEHVSHEEYQYFPNPERIDKVQISMENLETVVRERNRAYYELETGVHGERPMKYVKNMFGLIQKYKLLQHFIPQFMNTSWREKYKFNGKGRAVSKFLSLFREKMNRKRRQQHSFDCSDVKTILRRFPNTDPEALKAKYPNVDLDRMKRIRRSRGHCVNTI